MNRKHFLIYRNANTNVLIKPRTWAFQNQQHFPAYNFQDAQNNHPTTEAVENYLIHEFGFQILENNDIVVCYSLNDNPFNQ